jgi:hypothetical protein
MPHSEAQAWWADVQHVRESIERRRARGIDSSAPLDAAAEHRFSRRAAESLPPLDDFDWSPGPTGRFDRTGRAQRGDHARPRARRTGAERRGGEGAGDHFEVTLDTVDAVPTSSVASAEETASPATPAPLSAPESRRTVTISGRGVAAPTLPRLVEVERRRPARRPVERVGPRPDRIALWAVLLGFFLILVAATSSNAAVHTSAASHGSAVALHAPAR